MDHTVYKTVLGAASVLASPEPTQHALSMATSVRAAIEAFKARPDAEAMCLYILNTAAPEHTPHAQFTMLQVLEHVVKETWSTKPEEAKRALKQQALAGVSGAWLKSDSPTFVKGRLAMFLVCLARHDWPQRWPEMSDQLIAFLPRGGPPTEVVAMVFAALSDEASINDLAGTMPRKRRDDVMQGLKATLPQVMPPFLGVMQAQLSAPSADSPALLSGCVTMVASYLAWMPLPAVDEMQLVRVLAVLLAVPAAPVQEAAVACVAALACRKFDKHPKVRKSVLATCVPACAALLAVPRVDQYKVQREAARCLASFSLHLTWLIEQRDAPLLVTCMEAIKVLYKFPSLLPMASVMPMLTTVFGKAADTLPKPVVDMVPELIMQTSKALTPDALFMSEADVSTEWSPFLIHDFDDEHDYKQTFSQVKVKAYLLLNKFGKNWPRLGGDAVAYLAAQATAMKDELTKPGAPQVPLDAPPLLLIDGLLRTCVGLVQPVLKAVKAPAQAANSAYVIERLVRMVTAVTEIAQAQQPGLMVVGLRALGRLDVLYQTRSDILNPVMGLIVGAIQSTLTNPADPAPMAALKLAVHDVAVNSAALLCKTLPSQLVSHAGPHCATIAELASQVALPPTDRVNLIEAAVRLGNAVKDVSGQQKFVEALLKTPLEYWCSAEFGWAESPVELTNFAMRLCGTRLEEGLKGTPDTHLHAVNALTAFGTVARTAKIPGMPKGGITVFGPYWARVLPRLVQLLVSLNSIWQTDFRRQLVSHDSARWLVCLSPDEVSCMVGETAEVDINDAARPFLLVSTWVHRLYNLARGVLSVAVAQGAQSGVFTADCLRMLGDGVLGQKPVANIRPRHMPAHLKRLLVPILTLCPPELRATVFPALLVPSLVHAMTIVRDILATSAAAAAAPAGAGLPPPTETIADEGTALLQAAGLEADVADQFKETLWREIVRSVIDMLAMMARPKQAAASGGGGGGSRRKKNKKKKNVAPPSDAPTELMRVCFFGSPELSRPLLTCGVHLVAVPDGIAFRRIMAFWSVMATKFRVHHDGISIMQEVMQAFVSVLMAGHPWVKEVDQQVSNFVCGLYYFYVLDPSNPHKSVAPRDIFLRIEGVSPDRVAKLEASMTKGTAKKRPREFRRFIQDVVESNPAALAAYHAATVKAKQLASMVLPDKVMAFAHRPQVPQVDDVVSLEGLFGDLPDDDLDEL